jgi:hypothetical protein
LDGERSGVCDLPMGFGFDHRGLPPKRSAVIVETKRTNRQRDIGREIESDARRPRASVGERRGRRYTVDTDVDERTGQTCLGMCGTCANDDDRDDDDRNQTHDGILFVP